MNDTVANLTANVTGSANPSGWMGWISGALKWLWGFFWDMVNIIQNIMHDNPVVGFIVVIMIAILLFWMLTLSQVAAAQGMKMFLYIGLIAIVFFIVWYLQGEFGLTGIFSNWLQGSIGMPVNETNMTNSTVEIVRNVTDHGGTSFWT